MKALLQPSSIAIVGASADAEKVSGRPLKYLLDKGYPGPVYPVNPRHAEIRGLRSYPTIADLPQPVDLAIVVLPAAEVIEAVRALGARGVRSALVFSSGFAETGEEGRSRERALAAAARQAGVRLCGPNCLGLINAFDRVCATFSQYAEGETRPGPIGFVTQSGAFGTAIAALARQRGLGLGYFVNTGNEADVGFAEVMRAVIEDPRIRVGAGYLEGLKDGGALVALAGRALALGKPLVLTKVGRTGAGARAAASHTGSLAGEDAAFDALARQYGIVRARNEEHMLDLAEAFASCALPAGDGIGLVTQSGGAGVLMADRAEELGLRVPALAQETQRAVRAAIPAFGAAGNPVDVTGQFVANPEVLRDSVLAVLADPGIDLAIVWLQLMERHAERLVRLFEELHERAAKPFLVSWVAASAGAVAALRARGIAVLRGAEPAVDAAAGLVRFAARRRLAAEAAEIGPLPRVELPERGGAVPTLEASALLAACGVPMLESVLARNAQEAAAAAAQFAGPVALKVESPDILHKTEAGGVRLGLRGAASVRAACREIFESARVYAPGARLEGVIVQPMAEGEVELVVGLKRDPVFGPLLVVGLGGVLVEVLRDVALRRAPVAVAEAKRMFEELRGAAILRGVRGRPPVDVAALAVLASAVSRFGAAAGPRLRELDLNPVLAGPHGAVAVDVLMLLDPL